MKLLGLLLLGLSALGAVSAQVGKMVCYYDAASQLREGVEQMSLADLDPALQFCNYLVYGYAGVDSQTFQLKSLNVHLDINRDHYRRITDLRRKYPQLRVLLSVGGDRDIEPDGGPNKYLRLLEEPAHRQAFVNSVRNLLRAYGFDGLDLAWQFPKNHERVVESGLRSAWNTFKGWFSSAQAVDEHADEHKKQFTSLVRELKDAFRQDVFSLTLTMLPHVDPALFIDIFTVTANVDFVNLCTFDFHTPIRDPKLADYPAPLYEAYERDPTLNVNYHVDYWLNNTAPADKINVGIAAYGRAWQMSQKSGLTGHPPVPATKGAAPPNSAQNVTLGVFPWPVTCAKLQAANELTGWNARLRKVGDPTRRYGSYAYHAAEENEQTKELEPGTWVGYEEPTTAAIKAGYVSARGLGGVAFFDLSMDDFKGQCAGERYPILRSIKHKL